MGLDVSDLQQMTADIEKLRVELEDGYAARGAVLPPPDDLREQARCAWVYMTIRGVIHQEKEMAAKMRAKLQAERMAKPPIILPGGRIR